MNPSFGRLTRTPTLQAQAAAARGTIPRWSRLLMPLIMLAAPANAQVQPETGTPSVGQPTSDPEIAKSPHGRPAILAISDLADFDGLPVERKRLIKIAIETATESPWLPYLYGGADPAQGGFDCSGAMYYVMTRAGLTPPRSAAAQYLWLEEHKRLHPVAEGADSADHPSLRWLKPGDLLFWSTGDPTIPGETVTINHVAMYLGPETRDARKVMINSTDGRSYRGTKSNGYGIYDFRLPTKGSKSKLIGYGTPPGIPEIPMVPGVVPQAPKTGR